MKYKTKIMSKIFILITVFFVTAGFVYFAKAEERAEQCTGNSKICVKKLDNGIYSGKHKILLGIKAAEVNFRIKDNTLVSINFKTLFNTPGRGDRQKIKDKIKQSGDFHIDSITGATRTLSYAKGAIKNAIQNGPTNIKDK